MAAADLALYGKVGPVALSAISQRQEISLRYLEQIFLKLKNRELVQSVRGAQGGYLLARPGAMITVAEVIEAVDRKPRMVRCTSAGKGCLTKGIQCLTHGMWAKLDSHIHAYLSSVTLDDISKQQVTTEACHG